MLDININYTITQLSKILPEFIAAILITAILTPFIGKIAHWIKAIDLPAHLRKRTDRTIETRVHSEILPRLGGVAIFIAFISLMFYVYGFTLLTSAIGISLSVLVVSGIVDDKFDISGSWQLFFQIVAVVIVVLAGVRIEMIDIMNHQFYFNLINIPFELFSQSMAIVLPADLITIFWFLVIINAMNWVAGIDALEETMAWVAGATLMLIAIRFGRSDMLPMIGIFTGAVIGFWIFNFPPAKILGGTVGNTILGLLLAIFSILIDGKLTTTLLILALPLIDFVWVLIGRIITYRELNPIKLMGISGRHHLHHRLMIMGYSNKQILLIEISIFSIFGVIAYANAGFNQVTVAILAGVTGLLLFFTILTIIGRIRTNSILRQEKKGAVVKEGLIKESPEKIYRY
jgi:UDP-GlcNAc:undecaprenyl-phosphate/decaprenyl-phosphate GlcNAc-1-phosphate transferase